MPQTAVLTCAGAYSVQAMPCEPHDRECGAARLADRHDRARVGADEEALQHHGDGRVRRDQLLDGALDGRQALLDRLARAGAHGALRDRDGIAAVERDHAVARARSARVDAENDHGSRVGAGADGRGTDEGR